MRGRQEGVKKRRGGKRGEEEGGGEEEKSAHESQEVVVIVTESLYLSIRSISGILLLWGKKSKKKKNVCMRPESFFTEAELSAFAHARILANQEPLD